MTHITIDYRICEGAKCRACAYACPTNVFSIDKGVIQIKSPDFCKLCCECLEICPYAAISIGR